MITVALSKGRLFDDFVSYLEKYELYKYSKVLKDESRALYTIVDNIRFIFAKGPDVPVYVERGVADIGIVGSDIIEEEVFSYLNVRSEEHTSELQSRFDLVCRLLLEKK